MCRTVCRSLARVQSSHPVLKTISHATPKLSPNAVSMDSILFLLLTQLRISTIMRACFLESLLAPGAFTGRSELMKIYEKTVGRIFVLYYLCAPFTAQWVWWPCVFEANPNGIFLKQKKNLLWNVHSSHTDVVVKPFMVFVSVCKLPMVERYWRAAVGKDARNLLFPANLNWSNQDLPSNIFYSSGLRGYFCFA
jgi:hypothetical protein